MSSDREERVYRTPKLTPEELAEWREDCRKFTILSKLRQYLSYHEFSPNKWDPLLKGETKPERLKIEESEWQEAQELALLLKRREEETYEDDFEDPSSSSSSSSSTSIQSSSSMEYGALRVTSPFSISSQPDKPTIHKTKEALPNESKKSNIKFSRVFVKDFYVSKRERRMKSEACPLEMVRRNEEEVRIESMLQQIKMDETDDLDCLVFRKLKFKNVHLLQRGERGGDDESVPKRKERKVPTYADFLKKSGPVDIGDKMDADEITKVGHTAELGQDHKPEVLEDSINMDKALFTAAGNTKTSVHDTEVSDIVAASATEGITAAYKPTVPGEPKILTTTLGVEYSVQRSAENDSPEMTNEEIIAKLEEQEITKKVNIQEKSYSAENFEDPANTKENGVKVEHRKVGSAPLFRLNTVAESITKCSIREGVPRVLLSGDVRHTPHSTCINSSGLGLPQCISQPKRDLASADSGRILSTSIATQSMHIDIHGDSKNVLLKKISSAGEIVPRMIHVKPAPGTELDDSSEESTDEETDMTKDKYCSSTGSQKADRRTEDDTPSSLTNYQIQTQSGNTRRPRWRRRMAEFILRKLRRVGDHLKMFNCARCI